jgi:hypothetical protein
MSNKDLIEDLNHLRIKYGSTNVYKTLLTLLRTEYEELSSFFGVSQNNMPTSIFYPTNSTDFYKEYMELMKDFKKGKIFRCFVYIKSIFFLI